MVRKQQVVFVPSDASAKERRQLLQKRVQKEEVEREEKRQLQGGQLPIVQREGRSSFGVIPLFYPPHVGTGMKVAAANPFVSSWLHPAAGPVIGVDRMSGNRPFTFDPWEMYNRGLIASPNVLVEGSLRQGKSFMVKRLITLLALFGRYAINISDSKGEHGRVAEAIGGRVYRLGAFSEYPVRLNPLEAGVKRVGESDRVWQQRVRATRLSVLQQIGAIVLPAHRELNGRENAMVAWALDRCVAAGEVPTLEKIWGLLRGGELFQIERGYFRLEDARDVIDGFSRLCRGDLSGMFEKESTVEFDPDCPYTVFDTSCVGDRSVDALPLSQTVVNAWVMSVVGNKFSGRRFLVIREEGWRDMRTKSALIAHQEQLKLSGELGIAMVLIVHEAGDFDAVGPEGSQERELAKSLLRGYANRVCFAQSEATLRLARAGGLYTDAECAVIGSLLPGNFLVKVRGCSYVVDGTKTTTGFERVFFDTDGQMVQGVVGEGGDVGQEGGVSKGGTGLIGDGDTTPHTNTNTNTNAGIDTGAEVGSVVGAAHRAHGAHAAPAHAVREDTVIEDVAAADAAPAHAVVEDTVIEDVAAADAVPAHAVREDTVVEDVSRSVCEEKDEGEPVSEMGAKTFGEEGKRASRSSFAPPVLPSPTETTTAVSSTVEDMTAGDETVPVVLPQFFGAPLSSVSLAPSAPLFQGEQARKQEQEQEPAPVSTCAGEGFPVGEAEETRENKQESKSEGEGEVVCVSFTPTGNTHEDIHTMLAQLQELTGKETV